MTELRDWIERCIREYNQKLDALDKGECIDSENYTKHLYWNRGFIEGCMHAMERIERKIDEIEI